MVDKEEAQARRGIFMIDASGGFTKDGPKNRLRAQDIHRIVDVFNKQTDVPKYARMVAFAEIRDSAFASPGSPAILAFAAAWAPAAHAG
ncbi:N-6 DNA Methylase [compost metagenome]